MISLVWCMILVALLWAVSLLIFYSVPGAVSVDLCIKCRATLMGAQNYMPYQHHRLRGQVLDCRTFLVCLAASIDDIHIDDLHVSM